MRYTPYESEYAAVPGMSAGELMDYFLLRVFETEELWGVSDGGSWMTFTRGDQEILPLWPYERYASEVGSERWQQCQPASVSLEYFIYEMAEDLISQGLMVEVLPRWEGSSGCLVSPYRLLEILEGMRDAGEYRLDG